MTDVYGALPPTGPTGNVDERNTSSPQDQSLLELLRHGKREEARLRIENYKDEINQVDDGSTPLLVATTRGWGDVVEALVRNGANVNATSDLGETPLMRAIKCGKISSGVIKLILDHGGVETLNHAAKEEAFFSKWTALHFACDPELNHSPVVVALLVSYGANTKAVASNGKSPAEICGNNQEALKALQRPKDYLKHHSVTMRSPGDDEEMVRQSGEPMQLGSEQASEDDRQRSSLLQSAMSIFSKPKKSSLIDHNHSHSLPSIPTQSIEKTKSAKAL